MSIRNLDEKESRYGEVYIRLLQKQLMIELPNNKLILNWHKIFNQNQLFEFFSKKFNCRISTETEIEKILKNYDNLNIAIRHSDTFLKEENEATHNKIIELLQKHWTVKQTWKIKKI